MLPHRRQRQPAKDKCHRNNVDDGVWLGVVYLLRAPVRDLSPPRRSPAVECAQRVLSTLSVLIAHFVHTFWNTTHFVYTVFVLCAYLLKAHRTLCTHLQNCVSTYCTLACTLLQCINSYQDATCLIEDRIEHRSLRSHIPRSRSCQPSPSSETAEPRDRTSRSPSRSGSLPSCLCRMGEGG